MEKKHAVLIIGIILIIVIAVILIFFLKPKTYQSYFNEEFEKCTKINQNKYNEAMARKTGDASFCEKLPAEGKRACLAGLKKDTSICNEYPEEQQESCKADILKNPEMCPLFDYWCMAYASGDETHCQRLEDEASKKECIEYVRNDAEAFVSPQAEQACSDSAYVNAAIQTQDTAVCNKIVDSEFKQQCLASFT